MRGYDGSDPPKNPFDPPYTSPIDTTVFESGRPGVAAPPPAPTFTVGDTVRLRSGGPVCTIVSYTPDVGGEETRVSWFVGEGLATEWFPAACLERAIPEGIARSVKWEAGLSPIQGMADIKTAVYLTKDGKFSHWTGPQGCSVEIITVDTPGRVPLDPDLRPDADAPSAEIPTDINRDIVYEVVDTGETRRLGSYGQEVLIPSLKWMPCRPPCSTGSFIVVAPEYVSAGDSKYIQASRCRYAVDADKPHTTE